MLFPDLKTFAAAVCVMCAAGSSGDVPKKKFILFGWELQEATPAQILANADKLKGTSFDGVGIRLKAKDKNGKVWSQKNVMDATLLADEYVWFWSEHHTTVKWENMPLQKRIDGKDTTWEECMPGFHSRVRRAGRFRLAYGRGLLQRSAGCGRHDARSDVPAEAERFRQGLVRQRTRLQATLMRMQVSSTKKGK